MPRIDSNKSIKQVPLDGYRKKFYILCVLSFLLDFYFSRFLLSQTWIIFKLHKEYFWTSHFCDISFFFCDWFRIYPNIFCIYVNLSCLLELFNRKTFAYNSECIFKSLDLQTRVNPQFHHSYFLVIRSSPCWVSAGSCYYIFYTRHKIVTVDAGHFFFFLKPGRRRRRFLFFCLQSFARRWVAMSATRISLNYVSYTRNSA